jgi:ubiquitin-like modifier-activating enzyme ATG7
VVRGTFKNFNTIEEFRATEAKKELFNSVVDQVCQLSQRWVNRIADFDEQMLHSFKTPEPHFNPILLVTFADLKKYNYHYWFAFPALVAKPAWEIDEPGLESVDNEVGCSF